MADKVISRLKHDVADIQEQMKDLKVNVALVNEISYEMRHEEDYTRDDFYHNQKKARRAQVIHRLGHVKYMRTLNQKLTPKCACGGNHKGLMFISPKGDIVEENYCPRRWWVNMNWITLSEGKRAFSESTPLTTYLKAYEVKSG